RKRLNHRMKTTHGRGVFASGRKWALGAKSGIETAQCQRISGTGWKKVLANRWNRRRITKKAHAGRGLETIWEIPVYEGTRGIPIERKGPQRTRQGGPP